MKRLWDSIARGFFDATDIRYFACPRSLDPMFWIALIGMGVLYGQVDQLVQFVPLSGGALLVEAGFAPSLVGGLWFLTVAFLTRAARGDYRRDPWDPATGRRKRARERTGT